MRVFLMALCGAAAFATGGDASIRRRRARLGLRRTNDPITEWPQLVEKWLRTIGVVAQ